MKQKWQLCMKSHQPCFPHLSVTHTQTLHTASWTSTCLSVIDFMKGGKYERLLWWYYVLAVTSAPGTCLPASQRPVTWHGQDVLPLATTTLNLILKRNQGKTTWVTGLKSPSQRSLSQMLSHATAACHVTMKCRSADVLSPCEAAE